MSARLTPGPVFVYESIAAARRWQVYALRVLLVGSLLGSLWIAWFTSGADRETSAADLPNLLATVAQSFYLGAAGVQVALALVVAPAAAAGSICVDRARGWLTHAFVTDLSDAEIALGKLASRYVSAAGLVLTGLPVFLLATLLGGIIPEALFVLAAVTLLVLLLGCSLSMAVSSRATRSHEVLILVFGAWAVWLCGPRVWQELAYLIDYPPLPRWVDRLNPFSLVYAPYLTPGYSITWDLAVFATGCLVLSAACILFTIRSLRLEPLGAGPRSRRFDAALARARGALFSWMPEPTLDGNPVLWREWRLGRSTQLTRAIVAWLGLLMVIGIGVGLFEIVCLRHHWFARTTTPFLRGVSLIAALLGFLFLSAAAPSSLAEERARGSLDLLLGTPLSTREIVLGKWWAAFRRSFPFLFFSGLSGLFVAATAVEGSGYYGALSSLTIHDRGLAAVLPSAFLLVHAAAITSVGLLFATWIRRTSRAVAASITTVVLFSAGWYLCGAFVVDSLLDMLSDIYFPGSDLSRWRPTVANSLSPLAGQMAPYEVLLGARLSPWRDDREAQWVGLLVILAVIIVFDVVVLGLVLGSFDRYMGRVGDLVRPARGNVPNDRVGSPAIGLEGNPAS